MVKQLDARRRLNLQDPVVREMIVEDYMKFGSRHVNEVYGVPDRTVRRWKSSYSRGEELSPHYSESGRHHVLSLREVRKIEAALLRDPFMSNKELAAIVGNKITPRAVGYYLKNSKHGFVWKIEKEDVEESFMSTHVEEGRRFIDTIRRIRMDYVVYVDETYISVKARRRYGRYPRGVIPWTPRNRRYRRYVAICACRSEGLVHPSRVLKKRSIQSRDFIDYVRMDLAPSLREGDVVVWDRLGRSGRSKSPTALHFSPEAAAMIEERGARVLFLPPNGKLFNPLEIVIGEIKRLYDQAMKRKCRFVLPSNVPFEDIIDLWHTAEGKIDNAVIRHSFRERKNGREFIRVCREKGLLENDK